MVALPKNLKYKQEIFGAIINVFLEKKDDEVHYREVWHKVKELLGRQVSFRDFQVHMELMESKRILKRRDPGERGSKVFFSLTERAKQMNTFKVLGIDETFKKRKKIYQLLLFFGVIKRKNPITLEQLYRLLDQMGNSRKALEISRVTNRFIYLKPIKGVEIIKWIQSDSRIESSAPVYHITIPGFTVDEFISYLKKLMKGKEPQPFPNYIGITDVPFLFDAEYSKSEIIDAIELLKKDGLIRPINDVFPGEMRYDIADKSLVDYIKDMWLAHDIDLRLLFERLVYCGRPNEEDVNSLKFMYGKRFADRIISNAHYIRKTNQDLKDREQAKSFIQDLNSYRRSFIERIIETHREIIIRYEIANWLIEGICLSTCSLTRLI